MKPLKKERADYTLKVRQSTGKKIRNMAHERSKTVSDIIEILLEKVLNQKV